MPSGVSRRGVIIGGIAGAIPAASAASILNDSLPWTGGAEAPPGETSRRFFSESEAAFVKAAAARIIPEDELGPGAVAAGVPEFIDSQLAGEFGAGTRWYMQGPWAKGLDTQGYQNRLPPAAMYRSAIAAIDGSMTRNYAGKTFAELAPSDQDEILSKLEQGKLDLGNIDGKSFFEMFLQNVMEGFWSDPIYGGNKDMVGWKLIGFPGARYDHRDWVAQHGKRYTLPPVGLKGRPAWNGKP